MKRITGIAFLLLISIGGWQLGAILSSDAIGMVLGVLFGMMAGIPAALIAFAAAKNNEQRMRIEHTHRVIVETPSAPLVQTMTTFEPRPKVTVVDERQRLAASIRNRIEVHQ